MPSSDAATLAKYARSLNAAAGAKDLPALIFLTDQNRVPDPVAVIHGLGAESAVIFRDYEVPNRTELALRLRALCQKRGVRFLVAADGDLAEQLEADGLHMPEYRIDDVKVWRSKHPAWLITAASHSLGSLEMARRAGADAALLSPVFPTASHPETQAPGGPPTLGPDGFANLADQSPLPVYALGGITADNAHLLRGRRAVGLAAIGALDCGASAAN